MSEYEIYRKRIIKFTIITLLVVAFFILLERKQDIKEAISYKMVVKQYDEYGQAYYDHAEEEVKNKLAKRDNLKDVQVKVTKKRFTTSKYDYRYDGGFVFKVTVYVEESPNPESPKKLRGAYVDTYNMVRDCICYEMADRYEGVSRSVNRLKGLENTETFISIENDVYLTVVYNNCKIDDSTGKPVLARFDSRERIALTEQTTERITEAEVKKTEKKTSPYVPKSTKSSTYKEKMPDCDDYDTYEEFMDDWDGKMPDGSDAEDYWEDW